MSRPESINVPVLRRRRLPSAETLALFEVASRHMSFADAAVELGITTKKLHQRLEVLQRDLSAVLFAGNEAPIALTEVGRMYFGQLTEIFADLRRVTGVVPKQRTRGRISIAAGPTLGALWLIPRLKQFERQWPDIHLSFVPETDNGKPAGDLQLILSKTRPKDRVVHLSVSIELFPVCSPSVVSSKPFNSIGDLRRFSLLHCDRGEEWRKWLRVARGDSLDSYGNLKLPNASLAVQAALHGQGVALASHITVSHLLTAGKLVAPFKQSVFSPFQMYITSEGELSPKALPRTFLAWAAEQLREGRKHPAFNPRR
ncbi:MAG: LysR substrate-binding domain-containing protein [Rhodospirillaceae bacterium]